MDILRCIIVEDEPIAAEIIADYIAEVPFLECVGNFNNPMKGMEWLMENKVDVIFLDINMPLIKGHEFIAAAKGDYQYIITTAYQEFAVDSYQWGVVDYLLKPVDFPRFASAAAKLKRFKKDVPILYKPIEIQNEFKYFNVNKNFVKVNLKDIRTIESIKDYLKITSGNQTILTKGKLSDLEEELKGTSFIRTHRSFIINIFHLESFNHNEIFIAGKSYPIGRQYKGEVLDALNRLVKR